MLETWIPNLLFVKCLGALCLDASRGVGNMPNFEKHYFVLWWNIILLYLQPSGLSSAIWGFTEQSALFSPGESLRDNQVSISVPQILLLPRIKNPRLFQSCWRCTFTLYMLSLWNPVLWLNVLCPSYPLSVLLQLPRGRWAVGCHGILGWRFFDRCGDRNLHGWRPDCSCLPWGKASGQPALSRKWPSYQCPSKFCNWWDFSLRTGGGRN